MVSARAGCQGPGTCPVGAAKEWEGVMVMRVRQRRSMRAGCSEVLTLGFGNIVSISIQGSKRDARKAEGTSI